MHLLRDESGFTLIEVLVVCTITVILVGSLATVFGIGLQTGSTTGSIAASQTGVVVAFDRLDYEARCASHATLISGGSGVALTLPAQCSHASGMATWCVTNGSLIRFIGASCTGSGTGLTLVTGVTSSTPFSCVAPVGNYPEVKVALAVTTSGQSVASTDVITMMNTPLTTAGSAACA